MLTFASSRGSSSTIAPLLCYLIGLAAARGSADVDRLADAVTQQ